MKVQTRKQIEIEIEQRDRTYAEILSIEADALSRLCAICTMPIILTKDGVIRKCDQCVYKKTFQQRVGNIRQSLELNNVF